MQPLHLGKAVADLVVDQGPRLFRQAVGVLGWLDIPLPAWIPGLWALLCLSSLPGERPLMMSHGKERLVMALACIGGGVLSFLAVAIAIYVTWTPVGADELHLQGRYLHPCLLGLLAGAALLVPVVRGKRWPVLRRGALLTGALVIHTASLLVLLDRFKS